MYVIPLMSVFGVPVVWAWGCVSGGGVGGLLDPSSSGVHVYFIQDVHASYYSPNFKPVDYSAHSQFLTPEFSL